MKGQPKINSKIEKKKNQINIRIKKNQIWKKKTKIMDGFKDDIEKKLKFDKKKLRINLKKKNWGPGLKYDQTLNWKVKLKKKKN